MSLMMSWVDVEMVRVDNNTTWRMLSAKCNPGIHDVHVNGLNHNIVSIKDKTRKNTSIITKHECFLNEPP